MAHRARLQREVRQPRGLRRHPLHLLLVLPLALRARRRLGPLLPHRLGRLAGLQPAQHLRLVQLPGERGVH